MITATAKDPELALVVPCYGHPSLLVDALESALRQRTSLSYRIVLVNDGCRYPSTDRTCSAYARAHSDTIRYVKKANGGLSSARNAGVDTALSAWPSVRAIYFLDADNVIRPRLLERAYETLQEDSSVGWVFPDLHMFDHTRLYADMSGKYSLLQMMPSNYSEAGSMVRREVFDSGVRYDEAMKLGYEDWDFWFGVIEKGFTARHCPAMGFCYRRRPESMVSNTTRDATEVISYIRRKHNKLFVPKVVKSFEDTEHPRLAIFLTDRDEVVLTGDLHKAGRRMPWSEFAHWQRRWRQAHQTNPSPKYMVFLPSSTFEFLQFRKLSANLLWLLETDLKNNDFAILNIHQHVDLEMKVKVSEAHQASQSERIEANVVALWSYRFQEYCEQNLGEHLMTLVGEPCRKVVSARSVEITHTESPVALSSGICSAVVGKVAQEQAHCPADSLPPSIQLRLPARPVADPDYVYDNLFEMPPPPPWTPLPGERHLAIVTSQTEAGAFERVAANLARVGTTHNWHTHLVVIRESQVRVPHEFVDAFASYHVLPEASLTEGKYLVSVLGMMDVVLNHRAKNFLNTAGFLRRQGVKLINYVPVFENTSDGVPSGYPYSAIAYEHTFHQVLTASDKMRTFLLGRGVPPEKVFTLPSSPSFDLTDSRLEAILKQRGERAQSEPLRILFVDHFDQSGLSDREKGIDRLASVIQACKDRKVPVTWRIVSNSLARKQLACDDSCLHQLALDAQSLTRYYSWADVVLLLSRSEANVMNLLDAQQLGCIPVTTAVGAVPEQIEPRETGYLLAEIEETDVLTHQCLDILEALAEDRDELIRKAVRTSAERREKAWGVSLQRWYSQLERWCPARGE